MTLGHLIIIGFFIFGGSLALVSIQRSFAKFIAVGSGANAEKTPLRCAPAPLAMTAAIRKA